MEEEIVVDDIDENNTVDTQQSDEATTSVMPLLYIQQNKVCVNVKLTFHLNSHSTHCCY